MREALDIRIGIQTDQGLSANFFYYADINPYSFLDNNYQKV